MHTLKLKNQTDKHRQKSKQTNNNKTKNSKTQKYTHKSLCAFLVYKSLKFPDQCQNRTCHVHVLAKPFWANRHVPRVTHSHERLKMAKNLYHFML